jgi:peptide/nickel transport system substrate-binding protein
MDRRLRSLTLCLAACFAASAVHAQTLRWASQGDAQTMDPYSQNELLTNAMNGQVYETLVSRGKTMQLEPALATDWQQSSPTQWRLKLRPNVKFHDGSPFSADDVLFSIQRAKEASSDIAVYANAVGAPKKVDALTVEFNLANVNPIFLQHLGLLPIMSKAWAEKNKATKPIDFKNKEEGYASFNASGTGPYMLVSRQPDVKTVYKRNPNWWGKFDGNVQEVVYTPIKSDATRVAALISGEVDFILDPAPQDLPRLRNTGGVRVIEGPENRIVFIGMDQLRDELLYSSVKGKNPFKDQRVRQAFQLAIDTQAIKTQVLRGLSIPTGVMFAPQVDGYPKDLDKPVKVDRERARKLLAEAGYPNGFEVTLDCPNNRYIADEKICVAAAAMLAQVNIKVKVNAMPRASYFPKIQNLDTSFYMLGWGVPTFDSQYALQSLLRTRIEKTPDGDYNLGRYSNPKVDEAIDKLKTEVDTKKRAALAREVTEIHMKDVGHIPLHFQVIPWAMRSNVSVIHRADNRLTVKWVKIQ